MEIYINCFAEIILNDTNKSIICATENYLMTKLGELRRQGLYPGDDFDIIAINPCDAPRLTNKLRAAYAMNLV